MKIFTTLTLALALPMAVLAQTGATLEKIKANGALQIGYNETTTPFSFTDSNGQPQGYAIDLCKKVAEKIQTGLGLPNMKTNFVPVTSQTRIPLLVNGTIDLECASTSETLTRAQQVDFSLNHFVTGTRCMAREDSGIRDFNGLTGKTVALAQGSTTERHIERIAKQRDVKLRVLSIKSFNEGLIALESNRVDAFCTDDVILQSLRAKSRLKDELVINDEMLSFEPLALMVRRDDSAFRLLVNTVLSDTFRDGGFEPLYKKWFEPIGFTLDDRTRLIYELNSKPH